MCKPGIASSSCIGIFVSILMAACGSTQHTVYFANQQSGIVKSNAPVPPTIIHENDILAITVSSLNVEAASVFNAPNIPVTSGYTPSTGVSTPFAGYVVDNKGTIQFPLLGNLNVKGMTINDLRDDISKRIIDKKLLVDPIVNIRYLNFKVTVLGEVGHPLVINVPNQKISLFEALGLAGDITIYGKKDNVVIIREEENNQKNFYRVNLNSSEIFNSPYYYLKTNDVVYVEPNKARVGSSSRANTLLPILLSGLSFAAIIIDRITR